MTHKTTGLRCFAVLLALGLLSLSPQASHAKVRKLKKSAVETAERLPVLWVDPADIQSRDLFYGPGGQKDQPQPPFTFVEEDMSGTNPKYVVRDRDQVKWTVKLGLEARPETAASRLVWAAGYFANEDYFLARIQIDDMPAHVHRGGNRISPGGVIRSVRLKRHIEGEKKTGNWHWRDNPLAGSREMNGLKAVMALINNWDLKDENAVIYSEQGNPDPIYMVSDLGASFGADGITFPKRRSKDNLNAYTHSKFIRKLTPELVDFGAPGPPARIYILLWPPRFVHRTELESVGRGVPRTDAHWMGEIMKRLSPYQIREAFRAAGYSPEEIEGFSRVLENRIGELDAL